VKVSRTTIKDIAKECDVSLSTVSLVLNNNPRISASTREKVLAAVEKHQYQPNAFARSLASKSSKALSVVVPHLNHVFADVYFGEIVSGIYEHATDLGYKVLLDVANQRFVGTQEYIKILKSRRVDGMLFIGSSVHDQFLMDFNQGNYPFMLVNHYFPKSNLNCIMADYPASARLAADHLIKLGHRHIGLITGTNTYTAVELTNGFVDYCASQGLRKEDLPWADGWFTEQGGYEAAQWILERHPKITAIMAGNDKMAIGAIRYLSMKGVKIPGEVSVVGVDDIPAAQFTTPQLTTVRHDLYRIGRLAVDGLLAIFRKEIDNCHKILPVNLVVRESTGPAKTK
jgi:LacI family transcriptional regulator